MKFHNLCTCVLKIFLFGLFCGSFQFVPQSPVVPPAFFSVDILPFPSLIHFTNHFLCNPWFSCSLIMHFIKYINHICTLVLCHIPPHKNLTLQCPAGLCLQFSNINSTFGPATSFQRNSEQKTCFFCIRHSEFPKRYSDGEEYISCTGVLISP